MQLISHLCCTRKTISLLVLIVINCELATEAAFSSNFYGSSYSLLRRPRLELHYTSRDVGAMLHFYNADTIVDRVTDGVVNCTVSGGHLEDSLQRASSVSLEISPLVETWQAPKTLSLHHTLQTRTTFNISYDVEGNLTCRDTLGEGLVSNLLLRFRNRETLVVRFGANSPSQNGTEIYNNMRGIHRLYANITYSEQVGRLLDLRLNPEPQVTLRVSHYSPTGVFDQRKIHQAVTEVSEHIAKLRKLSLISVRSTRYCLDSEEGNFTWPITLAGLTTTPDNPCVDNNGTPLPERRCLGNFFDGVYWDEVPKRPHVCLDTFARSTRLLNLTRSLMKSNLVENLWEEIKDGQKLSPVEVYFASEALKKTAEKTANPSYQGSTPNIETVVNVINAIIHAGKPTIKAADESYGSSVVILESALKLMAAAASPSPTPINTQHFSAFASKAGVGIDGFVHITKARKGKAKGMVTKMRNIPILTYLRMSPNLLVYLYNQTEDYSIVSTRYEDDSLFSAAAVNGMRQEGPVLGIRLFQKPGNALEEMRPIPLFLSFRHESPKNYSLQCVMWESSVVSGGWSLSGCTLFIGSSDTTNCICMIITSMDMHFTLVRDDSFDDTDRPHLTLSPLKYNNGALLTFYNAQSFSGNLENQLSCRTSWGNTTAASQVTLQKIGNFTYNKYQQMIFFNISFKQEGYLQCKGVANSGLISNEVLLIKPNSATILISGLSIVNFEDKILKYLEINALYSNFTSLTVRNSSESTAIRVIQMSDNDHFDFLNILRNMSKVLAQKNGWSSMEIRSNRYCLQNDEGNFTWPTIKPGHSATPINPCINTLGAPTPSRKCIGDYFSGIYWDKLPRRPDPCEKPSERAQRLQSLSSNSLEKDIFKELLDSLQDNATLSVVESNQFVKVLKNVADEISKPNSDVPKQNLTSVGSIVNAVIDSKIKENSRSEENITKAPSDEILSSIDTLLEKASTPTAVPVITPHFSAVSVSPGTRFKGFTSTGVDILPVEQNQTLVDIANTAPTMGAFLVDAPEDVGMIYTNFNTSTLFSGSEVNEVSKVDSPILGLKIFAGEQKDVLPPNLMVIIIFAHDADKKPENRKCHTWDKDNSQWSAEGCIPLPSCDLPPSVSKNVDACLCTRLTHFAMLITDSSDSISEEHILHLASIVGCSISTISLLGVFIIGIIFPDWHRGASRKVQLNLSASLALLMGSYLVVSFQGDCPYSEELCISLGVMIHYSLLTAFTWMLVVAFLQCMRLTRSMALGARKHAGTHVVLRASVFAWGIPIVPVAGTLIAGTSIYARRQQSSLCYPTGRAFYAGVLFPVALIVSVNTLIFFWLMYSLFCNNFQTMRVHRRDKWSRAVRRFSSAFFLFCLLGICWLSGLFIELTQKSEAAKRILLYAFCVTVPLQGTSFFIFFVACDRRMGEKITRAVTIFSDTGGSKQSSVRYIAKFESSTSDKVTDTTNSSTMDRGKNKKINLSQDVEQQ